MKQVMRILYRQIYKPLLDEVPFLNKDLIKNSRGDLFSLIQSGKVVFYRGKFKGNFTATASRELVSMGAKWNNATQSWDLLASKVSPRIMDAIKVSDMAFAQTMVGVQETLSKIVPGEISIKQVAESFFNTEIFKLDRDLTKAIKAITVPSQLTIEEKLLIADEYSDNLEKYVKKFTEHEISRLREMVSQNVYSGNRYENLIKSIQDSFEVSENKARFLARQETKLLSTKYKEVRAVSSGSPGYYWRCVSGSPKHPVRPDHKRLDGQYIPWNDMPIVDLKTGRKAHAGEDFNCRCRPQIVFKVPDAD